MCYLLGRCRLVFLSRDVPMLLNNDGDILDKGALRIMPGDIINVEPSDAPLTGTPADSVAVRLWEVSTYPPPARATSWSKDDWRPPSSPSKFPFHTPPPTSGFAKENPTDGEGTPR